MKSLVLLSLKGSTLYWGKCSTGHPSHRLINKILELDANAEIYKTAGCNLVFHKGIDINCKSQTPAGIYSKMDGKMKR